MQKKGGIIAVIAGAVVVITAFVTLIMGGAEGIEGEGLSMVYNIGWGGVFFSFLVIIFGVMAMGAEKITFGILLTVSAILAAYFGGLFATILMAIALIGGIMTIIGISKREDNRTA